MKTYKKGSLAVLYSLLTYLFITFGIQDNDIWFFPSMHAAFSNSILFIALIWVYNRIMPVLLRSRNKGFLILNAFISAFFSMFCVMGAFFEAEASIGASFAQSRMNLIKAGIVFCGGFLLFYSVIKLIGSLRDMQERGTFTRLPFLTKIYSFFYEKNCFLKALLVLALCWLPQIIIRYPGALPVDSMKSLHEYLGLIHATTQHPIIYTVILGKFMDIGFAVNNPTLGLFLVVAVQVVVMLLVLAYTIHTLNKFRAPKWLTTLTLLFFASAPIFIATATTVIIDAFYGSFFLLLINELAYYLFMNDTFRKFRCHYVLTFIAVFGLHFRHNGMYISLGLIAAAFFMELFYILKKKKNLVYSLLFLAVLIIPAFGGKAVSNALYRQYDAQRISTRVMLSLPIQQVARCVVNHGNELEDQDFQAIQKVLKWEKREYAEKYNPLNFDGIKRGFLYSATGEDLANFLKVWAKLVIKYPDTCINATVNQNYLLFDPLVSNMKYYTSKNNNHMALKGYPSPLFIEKGTLWASLDNALLQNYYSFGKLPFLGLLVNQGFYNLMLLALCLYALFERNGKLLLISLPLLLTLAITFVGPTVYHHPRYTYPIMYTMPVLLGLFITQTRNQSSPKTR